MVFKNLRLSISRFMSNHRFLFLLSFMLMLIAFQPFAKALSGFKVILSIILSVTLISSIYSISQKKYNTVFSIFVALPLLVSFWVPFFYQSRWVDLLGDVCGVIFFAFIVVAILRHTLRQDEITGDLIAGAAVVYLIMAMMWSYAYRFIETVQPGSFSASQSQDIEQFFYFLYYSFVTITTLGYGDIAPITIAAKSFAILEAVIGQLYLVIMVAWLVGRHISQSMEKKAFLKKPQD
ncbi:potassium channel family protein [Thermodesulfobacteriota bacterium]